MVPTINGKNVHIKANNRSFFSKDNFVRFSVKLVLRTRQPWNIFSFSFSGYMFVHPEKRFPYLFQNSDVPSLFTHTLSLLEIKIKMCIDLI